jgi:hypothetical protein
MKPFTGHFVFGVALFSAITSLTAGCSKNNSSISAPIYRGSVSPKPPDTASQDSKHIVISDLKWKIDEQLKVLTSTFVLPQGYLIANVDSVYGALSAGHQPVFIPKFREDSTLDVYYVATEKNELTIFKKYQGVPPKEGSFDVAGGYFVAMAIFFAENRTFSAATVVFR